MDDLLYLRQPLLGIQKHFKACVQHGLIRGGDRYFASLCLILIALHEARDIDLKADEPARLLERADVELYEAEGNFNSNVEFMYPPLALKGDAFHHTGPVGEKNFDP